MSTSGSRASIVSRALLSACSMFIVGIASDPQLAALLDHAPIGFLEHALEHLRDVGLRLAQRADRLAGLHRLAPVPLPPPAQGGVTRLIPLAEQHQMLLEPLHGIPERPMGRLLGGP